MIIFVGAKRAGRFFRARVRLEDGSHRLSRRKFAEMGHALNWGTRWVRRLRRQIEMRLLGGQV